MQFDSPPETVEAFHARLQALPRTLPRRLRQCADYLAAHSDRIAVTTVADLAQAAGVQPSAVVRFCQRMGFSGFSELQRLFREGYGESWPDYATRLDKLGATGADSPGALLAQFVKASRISLEKLSKTIDLAALDAAVQTLAAARTVHVIGLRRAFPVATYLAYAFEKLAVPALLHDRLGGLEQQHMLRPGDALLAISFAPYSPETVAMAEAARAAGLPVVAITDNLLSPLSRPGATALLVPEVDFGAFRSLSATLAVALALAVSVGAHRQQTPQEGVAKPAEME
jgi:DNA-binding MurR/RpiR family transcriptional regulator